MPLLDHFHEPLASSRSWESFHSRWANAIADALNATLPERYLAEVHTHSGTRIEADVAEFDLEETSETASNGGGGTAVETWAPPAATMIMPAQFPDELEVRVLETLGGMRLVAVVEVCSPSNKDRPGHRNAFAGKCAAYLNRGLGLLTVDIVTCYRANLHNEMVELMDLGASFRLAKDVSICAVAYRPTQRDGAGAIDVWASPLEVGIDLPTLPLALYGSKLVPVDLEVTYTEARTKTRI